MSLPFARVPGTETVDERLPLVDVWGAKARQLSERLWESSSLETSVALIATELRTQLRGCVDGRRLLSPAQRALQWADQQRGLVRVDELADHAGLRT